MAYEDWQAAFEPKAHSSFHLVRALRCHDLAPWVIFLSSTAAVIGNRSQANYAAGNAVVDAVAEFWNQIGHKAKSIALGPVLGAGMLVEDPHLLDVLRRSGFFGVRHDDFLTVVKRCIEDLAVRDDWIAQFVHSPFLPCHIVLGMGSGGLNRQNKPSDPYWTRRALYRYLAMVDLPAAAAADYSGHQAQDADLLVRLRSCASVSSAASLLAAGLLEVLASRTGVPVRDIDPDRALTEIGVDSLVAVGVRGWALNEVGVDLAVLEVLGCGSVHELADVIARRGNFGAQD